MALSLGGYSRRVPGLRRIAIGAVALLAAVVLVLTVTVVVTVRRPLPEYSGRVEVPGLGAEVQVVRDDRGVPQMYADSSDDLFYAQGYVHAQDRFFEMDFRRHVTAGRLSELVGENEDALAADTVVRTLGWRRVAEAELPLLEPDTRRFLQAYADGVNAYIGGRSPAELSTAYPVLAIPNDLRRIEEWTPVDSLAWLKAMAWDLRSNYQEELGRAQVFDAVADVALVDQLYPPYDSTRHAPILPAVPQADSRCGGRRSPTGRPRRHRHRGRAGSARPARCSEIGSSVRSSPPRSGCWTRSPICSGGERVSGRTRGSSSGEHTESGDAPARERPAPVAEHAGRSGTRSVCTAPRSAPRARSTWPASRSQACRAS